MMHGIICTIKKYGYDKKDSMIIHGYNREKKNCKDRKNPIKEKKQRSIERNV